MDTYYLPDTHSPGKEVQDSLEKEILYGCSCRSQFRMKLKEDMVLLGPPISEPIPTRSNGMNHWGRWASLQLLQQVSFSQYKPLWCVYQLSHLLGQQVN